MIDYLKKNYGNRQADNEGKRQELEFLRSEIMKMRAGKKDKSTDSGHDDESSSGSGDEEFVDDLPVAMKGAPVGPRMSVSAEVFGKFNVEKAYVPPVYKKDDAQIKAITLRMSGNFMFASLNPKDKKAILEAVVPVKK